MMSLNSTEKIDLDIIFEDRPLKFVGVIFTLLTIGITFCLSCGIIWYEKYGADLKRTLTNRLVSSISWCVLESMVFICCIDLLLYFHRPLPKWICILQSFFRNAVLVRLLCLFDAIIIARYIFIFWIKNPLNFDDQFWCTFTNFWINFLR